MGYTAFAVLPRTLKRRVYIVSTQTPNQWLSPPAKITETLVEHLSASAAGQKFFRDPILKGFAVRVTANGVRSFIVEKRVDGKIKRITLGRYPTLSAEQARTEAHKVLGMVALGMNPIAEREHARLAGVTLAQAFKDFKRARNDLKARTLYDTSGS